MHAIRSVLAAILVTIATAFLPFFLLVATRSVTATIVLSVLVLAGLFRAAIWLAYSSRVVALAAATGCVVLVFGSRLFDEVASDPYSRESDAQTILAVLRHLAGWEGLLFSTAVFALVALPLTFAVVVARRTRQPKKALAR